MSGRPPEFVVKIEPLDGKGRAAIVATADDVVTALRIALSGFGRSVVTVERFEYAVEP